MGKKKAEKVKKIVKEANESTEYDIKVLALINASDVVVKSVLEIG